MDVNGSVAEVENHVVHSVDLGFMPGDQLIDPWIDWDRLFS